MFNWRFKKQIIQAPEPQEPKYFWKEDGYMLWYVRSLSGEIVQSIEKATSPVRVGKDRLFIDLDSAKTWVENQQEIDDFLDDKEF